MTLLQWLEKLAGSGLGLAAFLEKIAADFPDLAPQAQALITALNLAVTPASLSATAAALPKEFGDILRGKLEPGDRPSDSI